MRIATDAMRKYLADKVDLPVCAQIDRERIMRAICESTGPLVMPPGVTVECLNPGTIHRDRRIDMRVTARPIDWAHANKMLNEGWTLA